MLAPGSLTGGPCDDVCIGHDWSDHRRRWTASFNSPTGPRRAAPPGPPATAPAASAPPIACICREAPRRRYTPSPLITNFSSHLLRYSAVCITSYGTAYCVGTGNEFDVERLRLFISAKQYIILWLGQSWLWHGCSQIFCWGGNGGGVQTNTGTGVVRGPKVLFKTCVSIKFVDLSLMMLMITQARVMGVALYW